MDALLLLAIATVIGVTYRIKTWNMAESCLSFSLNIKFKANKLYRIRLALLLSIHGF